MKNFLVVNRWRITLGYSYVGMLGIGLVVAKTIQDILITNNISVSLLILVPFGVFILWLIGYLADILGYYSTEVDYISKRNPYFEKHLKGKNDTQK